jgi:Protein of unknown function (DUF2568)
VSDDAPQPDTPTPGHGVDLMSTPSLFALAVVAFAVELALFGGVALIFYQTFEGGPAGWLAAVVATAGILAFWGLLMAPRAKRRLAKTPRLVVSALLCVFTADGLFQGGYPWWGWFVGVAGIAVVVAQLVLPQADAEPR